MSEDEETRLGTRLGNYALKEIIGRGGMGVVYRASHIYLRKPAAVKVLHPRVFAQPGAKARFLHEAQAASSVNHPNLVGVHDFGEAPDGTIYIVMPEVPGRGMDLILYDEGTLPLFRTLAIGIQIATALGAVHERKIVHGDIKPENIMLGRRVGNREVIRVVRDGAGYLELVEPEECFDFVSLLDFGAAKMLQPQFAMLGDTGTLFGTPRYIAPETAQRGHLDPRSDVYALGILLYEMLTGTVPFDGPTPADTLEMQASAPPEPPTRRNPYVEITPEAERMILRALEKDPARRHATMDELIADLFRSFGSMRWRRPLTPQDSDLGYEPLRAPLRLTPDRARRRGQPTPPEPVVEPLPPTAEVAGPRILLTKRKERPPVSPEDTPTPPPELPPLVKS